METKNIIYTAGFFDGEGYIAFNENIVKRPNAKDSISYCIRIRIVNTNLKVIKILHKLWGGFIYHRKPTLKRMKPAYDLIIVKKEEVVNFIELTYPYLIVKKDQVDRALKSYELVKNYKFIIK
jgi:hypothetical protein